jgi:RNA polymerase sigma-70 factor (ECF subfamily)
MTNRISDYDREEIVKGCMNDDRAMQTRLFNLYYPGVYTTVSRYVTDDGDRDDIIQETFIKVFKGLRQLKDIKLLAPWINRIAVNLCMDQFKKNKKLDLSKQAYTQDGYMETDGGFDETDTYLLSNITMEDVNSILDELPTGFRTVFMLYAVENYSHKEIAKQLGTSESNSKTQYMRAKAAIKKLVNTKMECKKKKQL